jgi:hypothetical protein
MRAKKMVVIVATLMAVTIGSLIVFNELIAGSGKCTLCRCQSWQSDGGNPEKCINIKAPTKLRCGHLYEDHKESESKN